MSLKNALTNLIELTSNVADAYTTALYVADLETGMLTLRSHLSLSSHLNTDAAFTIGEGMLGGTAFSKETRMEDFAGMDTPELEWYSHPEQIKGLMVVPVMRRELEGVLVVDSKENYSFTPKLQKLISGFADQMAWFLSLEKTNPNWIDGEPPEFQQMIKWCRFISDAPHRKALSERFLHIPRSLIQCDAAAVVWFENPSTGRVTHSKGWKQGLKTLAVEPGSSLCGTLLNTGQPILVSNTQYQSSAVFSEKELPESFGSVMAAPITSDKRMLGMVVCANRAGNSLRKKDLDKLTLMTAFAASAVTQMDQSAQSDLILKPYDKAADSSGYFLPVHLPAFEEEIIKRGSPVSVLSIRLKNADSIFSELQETDPDLLLNQISTHLSRKVDPLKLFMKYSGEGLVLLLISINEQEACQLEEGIQEELSQMPITLGKKRVHVEFDYGLASFPTDGHHLKQLIEISWTRTRQPKEEAHG